MFTASRRSASIASFCEASQSVIAASCSAGLVMVLLSLSPSQGCGFGRSYAVVVQIGEDAIGRRECLVQLAGGYSSRLVDDLRQLAGELAVSLPDRVVAQVGVIGAERRELGDRIAAVDLRAW